MGRSEREGHIGTIATRRDVLVIGLAGLVIGAMLGAILVATAPAGAANGDYMFVGQKNNATRPTRLISKGGLVLDIGKVGNPALTLNVTGDTPPLQVNSTAKVTNLNADYLDSVSMERIRNNTSACSNADAPDGDAVTSWRCESGTETLPKEGLVLLTGSVEVWQPTGADSLNCRIQVKRGAGSWTDVIASRRALSADSTYQICATDAWYSIGTGEGDDYTFAFYVDGLDSNTDLEMGSFWWVYSAAPWGFADPAPAGDLTGSEARPIPAASIP